MSTKEKKKEKEEINHNIDEELIQDEEILILKNKIENLEEKVRFNQAELINYRKRKDDEVSNMLKFSNQELVLEILPLVDNFERAIKLSEKDENNQKFMEGFKMIYNNLVDTLKKFDVEEVNPVDEKFDANFHEALLVDSDKNKEDDIVLEVLAKGYLLKGRLLRPAKVKVNKIN